MHLKRNSTQELLMKWGIVRLPKNKKKVEMDVQVKTDEKTNEPKTEVSYKEINESEELPLDKDEQTDEK